MASTGLAPPPAGSRSTPRSGWLVYQPPSGARPSSRPVKSTRAISLSSERRSLAWPRASPATGSTPGSGAVVVVGATRCGRWPPLQPAAAAQATAAAAAQSREGLRLDRGDVDSRVAERRGVPEVGEGDTGD